MKESVREFVDKEIVPHKNVLNIKTIVLTEVMRKAGEMGF
jgi:hypothetical protein